MPYQSLVDELNGACDFTFNGQNYFEYELDGAKLFEQVKYAMNRNPLERNAALRNVILFNFTEDCSEYFYQSTRFNIYAAELGIGVTNEQQRKKEVMYNITKFYDQYLKIVTEMVKDIDPNHKISPFFGLTEQQTIDMQVRVSETFTSKDMLKFTTLNLHDSEYIHDDFRRARVDLKTNKDYDYNQLTDMNNGFVRMAKERIHSVYMMKKIWKEELKERGWWWRVRNWTGECKRLRDYIKAADATLKAVKFPREMGPTVEREFEVPYMHSDEKKLMMGKVTEKYRAHEAACQQRIADKYAKIDNNKEKDIAAAAEKDSVSRMFDVRFRPATDIDEFNSQIHLGNQLSKVLYHNKGIDSTSKAVFNANMQKMIAMKHYYEKYVTVAEGKAKPSEEETQKRLDEILAGFDKAEREFLYKNPNYVPATVDDVDRALTIRESVADAVNQDLNKDAAKTEVKEHESAKSAPSKEQQVKSN